MRKVLKFAALGVCSFLFAVALSAPAFAQTCDDSKRTELYETYVGNYQGNLEQKQKAVEAAKEFVKLCGNEEIAAPQVEYFKGAIPQLEQAIKDQIEANKRAEAVAAEKARFDRFMKAFAAKNYDEVFAAADEILKYPPVARNDFLDLRILVAATGGDLAASNPPVTKFDDQTIRYAQDAISRINAGEESGSKKWGGYNTKENAIGWLNYAIGYIKYYDKNDKDGGISYYYKATQFDSTTKSHYPLYATIGGWYRSHMADIGKKRAELVIDETAGENQKANIDQALKYLSMEKGYANRAMDAYARAYNIAKATKGVPESAKSSLYDSLKQLWDFRYSSEQDADKRNDESINSFIASVNSNSLPNPASEVQPVVEKIETEEPTDKATDGTSEGATSGQVNGQRSRTVESATAKKSGN